MNAEFFTTLGHADRLSFVVKNGGAASFAYERLNVHRRAARVQMDRIWVAAAAARSETPADRSDLTPSEMMAAVLSGRERMVPVLYEAHFYFVALNNCRNMLKILTGQPELLPAKKVYDSYRAQFEHYAAARHSFEHFHDRLPGQKDSAKVREIQPDPVAGARRVFFGFEGGNYKHSDTSWDITPAGLATLDAAIGEVLASVNQVVEHRIGALTDRPTPDVSPPAS